MVLVERMSIDFTLLRRIGLIGLIWNLGFVFGIYDKTVVGTRVAKVERMLTDLSCSAGLDLIEVAWNLGFVFGICF